MRMYGFKRVDRATSRHATSRHAPGAVVVMLVGLIACVSGCSPAAEPVDGAWSTVGDGWSDLGSIDAAKGDSGTADTALTDGGAVIADTGLGDGGHSGVGDGGDAGMTDSAAVDSGPADAGAPDTAPTDTGVADTGPVDAGGGLCASKAAAYKIAKIKALKCTSNYQCYAPAVVVEGKGFVFGAPEIIGCGCDRYYSDLDLSGQSLADLDAEFVKAGCKAACPKTTCNDLNAQIGVCKAGGCVTTSATCKEMEALVTGAVDAGRACKIDADCSNFGMQGSIPCGCAVNVNLSKLGPGKPLFLYITMITRAYNSLGCAKNVVCACQAIGKGACVQGMCVTK